MPFSLPRFFDASSIFPPAVLCVLSTSPLPFLLPPFSLPHFLPSFLFSSLRGGEEGKGVRKAADCGRSSGWGTSSGRSSRARATRDSQPQWRVDVFNVCPVSIRSRGSVGLVSGRTSVGLVSGRISVGVGLVSFTVRLALVPGQQSRCAALACSAALAWTPAWLCAGRPASLPPRLPASLPPSRLGDSQVAAKRWTFSAWRRPTECLVERGPELEA